MSRRQDDAKSPLVIRGEGCDFCSFFVLDSESDICERLRTGSVSTDWPRLSWAKRNYSFDARSGLCLCGRKTYSHDQEHQNDWQFSKCHHLIILTSSNWIKRFAPCPGTKHGGRSSATPNEPRPRLSRGEGSQSSPLHFVASSKVATAPTAPLMS